jgi:hypothetical protein
MRQYQVGDKVMLVTDALQIHSKSIPAHMGYTTYQFEFRDTLRKLLGLNASFEQGMHGRDVGTVVDVYGKRVTVKFRFQSIDLPIEYFELETPADIEQRFGF